MVKPTSVFAEISAKLEDLALQTIEIVPDDRSFAESWGWNMPVMNRHDFASFLRAPIEKIRKIESLEISEQDAGTLSKFPAALEYIKSSVIGNLPGGNAFHVYICVHSAILSINQVLDKYLGQTVTLEEIENKALLPTQFVNDLKLLRGQIESSKSGIKNIDDQMKIIKDGSEMLSILETDLQSLRDAKQSFNATQAIVGENISVTESAKTQTSVILQQMLELEKEAKRIIAAAQAASSAQTSVGLGREFEDRAKALQKNLQWLSIGLLLVLIIAGGISAWRLNEIHRIIDLKPLSLPLVWANVIAMFASLGPPIWLAWLITRQIGQRFRLAEDYSFKASVAKAYAGYREEAGRLNDVEFEKRLFETTMRRIDEEPLRHIDRENESTPFQSIIEKFRFKTVDAAALLTAINAINGESKGK